VISLSLQHWAGLDSDKPLGFAWLMLWTVAGTTAIWLVVTFLTPPEPVVQLKRFYERVRPGGWGWEEIAGSAEEEGPGYTGLLHWIAGCAIVYLGLFGTGQLMLGRPWRGALLVAGALVLTVWIVARAESAEPE
jgi:hypothetical protein